MSALDKQEGGDHYKKLGRYQPWEVLSKWLTPEELRGFAKGTVIAYLAREQDKGGRQDIKKALHTLQIYLELSESEDLTAPIPPPSEGKIEIEPKAERRCLTCRFFAGTPQQFRDKCQPCYRLSNWQPNT